MISVLIPVKSRTPINLVENCVKNIYLDTNGIFRIILIINPESEFSRFSFLLNEFSNLYIEYSRFPQISFSLNFAINKYPSSYYVRMDIDDIWLPGRTSDILIHSSNKVDVLIGGAVIGKSIFLPSYKHISLLWIKNSIVHPAVMFSDRFIILANGYLTSSSGQDYELWLRTIFLKSFRDKHNIKIAYSNIPYIEYRLNASSETSLKKNQTYLSSFLWKLNLAIKHFNIFLFGGSLLSLLKHLIVLFRKFFRI